MRVEISKRKTWQLITAKDVAELLHYRDLLYMMVKRDVTIIYKQTVLGFAWAIIKPVVQMVIFTIIFGKFAGMQNQIDGNIPYALFSFVALVPWTYFSSALSNATNSLVSGQVFITKVYFPRVIIPLTPVISKLVDFSIAFVIMLVMMFYYGIAPTPLVVVIPLLVVIMVMASLGMGLWLSALSIQYRDINQMMAFLVQLLMYLAPVIWPITLLPEKYRLVYGLYPMVGVIEGFRACLLGTSRIPWDLIGMGSITAVVLLFTGLVYFRNKEKIFADVA
ncbi:MAG: ABC transporter permease [Chitinophagales bacterium]|nr:ABC transporter permease [Chitinophagales bacterium]